MCGDRLNSQNLELVNEELWYPVGTRTLAFQCVLWTGPYDPTTYVEFD